MERNDSILGGALLLTAANLLLRLISIAFQVFLSVRIGAAGLGLMQLISTIGVFAMLAGTAGVRVTAMYLAAEEFGNRRLSGVRAAMRACLQYGILVSPARHCSSCRTFSQWSGCATCALGRVCGSWACCFRFPACAGS